MSSNIGGGWIGVDLDGTAAYYTSWKGIEHIGEPVPLMAARIRKMLDEGKDVRIFTARVCHLFLPNCPEERRREAEMAREYIQQWTEKHFGRRLPVTAVKDFAMIELYDDRCIQILANTGRRSDGEEEDWEREKMERYRVAHSPVEVALPSPKEVLGAYDDGQREAISLVVEGCQDGR